MQNFKTTDCITESPVSKLITQKSAFFSKTKTIKEKYPEAAHEIVALVKKVNSPDLTKNLLDALVTNDKLTPLLTFLAFTLLPAVVAQNSSNPSNSSSPPIHGGVPTGGAIDGAAIAGIVVGSVICLLGLILGIARITVAISDCNSSRPSPPSEPIEASVKAI